MTSAGLHKAKGVSFSFFLRGWHTGPCERDACLVGHGVVVGTIQPFEIANDHKCRTSAPYRECFVKVQYQRPSDFVCCDCCSSSCPSSRFARRFAIACEIRRVSPAPNQRRLTAKPHQGPCSAPSHSGPPALQNSTRSYKKAL